MNQNLTIEEKLNQILKNQEAVMNHLWNSNESPNLANQEQQVIKYLEQEIVPKAEAQAQGEMVAEGVWMELLINWIKQLTLQLVTKALEHLLDKGADWAVDGAQFALEKLQDFLFEKYQLANEKQKENFKRKILEKFPDSGLANKLRNGISPNN